MVVENTGTIDNTEPHVNFAVMLKVAWEYKVLIIITTLVFAVASVVYALSLKNMYTSTATVSVVQNESAEGLGAIAGRLGGLASLAGVSLGGQALDSSTRVIATIQSMDFLQSFVESNSLHEKILAIEGWDRESDSLYFDPDIYDEKLGTWIREPKQLHSQIPTSLEVSQEFLENYLSISQDIETGLIKISVSYYSPSYAKQWVIELIAMLNDELRERDVKEIEKSLQFLHEQLGSVSNTQIKAQLYELIQERTEKLMFANAREDYAVDVIDSPFMPEEKSKPARAIICIVVTMLGFIISFSVALFLFLNRKA